MKLLLILALLFAQTSEPVTTQYDRFKNETTVSMDGGYLYLVSKLPVSRARFSAEYSYPGQAIRQAPKEIVVVFFVVSEQRMYPELRPSVIILADNKKVLDGDGVRVETQFVGNYVSEAIAVKLSPDTLKQMTTAKLTEIQIGTVEVKLTTGNIAAIKSLLEHVTP